MIWIKRNLFFVIGGVLALGLLGAAGFYDYASWKRNAAAFDKLNEVYSTLRELANQKPSPGNDKINNIEAARQQTAQLRDWIRRAQDDFQPIVPIPNPTRGQIADPLFGDALHRTIDQLLREATNANVSVLPQYRFSFQALIDRVKFAPGSLNALATQLGEVKAIAEILFDARVNQLDGIQRARVSDDDLAGPQTDYLADASVTNALAANMLVVVTPYAVTFRAFSPEIAQTLAGFASSPHAFIVTDITVQPAGAAPMEMPSQMGLPMAAPGTAPDSMRAYFQAMFRGSRPPMGPTPMAPAPVPGAASSRGGLQEQLLRATIKLEIVKLLPKG